MEKEHIHQLSSEEMIKINGGESIAYWIGFALGGIAGTGYSLLAGISGGLSGHHI